MTRILIADDHEVVRLGVRAILETQPGWKVVAEAENGRAAYIETLASKPDIVIMDYSLPMINGVEATRQILRRLPKTEIMIFTIHNSDTLIDESVHAGASAYVLKSDAKRYLIAAVASLVKHRPFFTGHVCERLLNARESVQYRRDESSLSPRESSVVKLVAEGHSNKEMGAVLSRSVKTIENHRASAMRKLNVTSVAALVRYAIRSKLVEE